MGGHVTTPRDGFPPWGFRDDFNVQQDRAAARVVFERCDPLVVPLAVTAEVTLRSSQVARLRAAGALGTLLADQAEAHARDNGRTELGRAWPGLPDDLLNFQYDPLACAVAAGWDGVAIEDIPTALDMRDGLLRMERWEGAPALRVVTEVDAPRFDEAWLRAVERASGAAAS